VDFHAAPIITKKVRNETTLVFFRPSVAASLPSVTDETTQHEPTGRHWISFWAVVVMQVVAAFNMNMSKVVLVALGLWLANKGQSFHGIEHVVAVALVVPYVLFSPTAGWLADRFPKSTVIRVSASVQVLLLVLLWLCLQNHALGAAVAVFFLLSSQATILSPSKMSVVKELVGGRRMGFASGVIEGTVILAILGGQIAGGNWFDAGLAGHPSDGWLAGSHPILWVSAFAVIGTLFTLAIQGTRAHTSERFSLQVATRHIRDLHEIFSDNILRRCGVGVGFFWGFGGFLYLAVLQIAEEGHGGGQGTGTAFARLWAMAVVGIATGSIGAGLASRKRIELGLSPLGGIVMTAATIALAFTKPESATMMVMLALTGAGAAVFLVPLQAVIQDRPAQNKRGAVLSASNLINNMLGIIAVALQFVLKKLLHISVPWQLVVMGAIALAFTVLTLRALPRDFVRILLLAVLRTFYRIRPVGISHIPQEGGVLLLPNHLSFGDAFFLSAACPRPVRFVMDGELTQNPWISRFARLFDTVAISTHNPRAAILTAANALQAGDVLCVFPEGQISRTGTARKIQRGFKWIAQHAKCPAIPVWLDGSWGSVFSFEGSRFFRKRPHAFPLRLTVAFSPPLAPTQLDPASLRSSLYQAAASAITERFRGPGWNTRLPDHYSADPLPPPETRKHIWINGYQIGQTNAIPWRGSFAVFSPDQPSLIFPSLAFAFPELLHPDAIETADVSLPDIRFWAGGANLRAAFAANPPQSERIFFDFSPEAATPLDVKNVIHCPCLAIRGIVIAMSLPDPPLVLSTSRYQAGHKAGSLGLLLPGFTCAVAADGTLHLGGPSLPDQGLTLPSGSHLDEDGFLFAIAGW
jgi:acyl-[acyl-carrier-protein]-phospholipid O-acyltransferase/long-chain-fatty-acid--[acyl-carrier-protein] ligase